MVDYAHCTLETIVAETTTDRSFPTHTPAGISTETGLVYAVSTIECRADDPYGPQKRQWIDSFLNDSAAKVKLFLFVSASKACN